MLIFQGALWLLVFFGLLWSMKQGRPLLHSAVILVVLFMMASLSDGFFGRVFATSYAAAAVVCIIQLISWAVKKSRAMAAAPALATAPASPPPPVAPPPPIPPAAEPHANEPEPELKPKANPKATPKSKTRAKPKPKAKPKKDADAENANTKDGE